LDYGVSWVSSSHGAATGFSVSKRTTVTGSNRRRRRRGKFPEETKVGLYSERPLSSLLVATPPTLSASWKNASLCKTLPFLSFHLIFLLFFFFFSYFSFSAFILHEGDDMHAHPTQFFIFLFSLLLYLWLEHYIIDAHN